MTVKEITALRKSGQLQAALEAAEAEFASAINKYTIGALFWCLNDLYKRQDGDQAALSIERMRTLYEEYGDGDELMQKSLAAAQKRIIPHYGEIKDAVVKAKEGINSPEILSNLCQLYNSSNLASELCPDLGWLIYYSIKNTPIRDVNDRKILLNQYLKLNLSRPSILHSRILAEAVKIEQNTPLQFRMRDFIRLWGLEYLMEADWEQFTTEAGHKCPSLVEKLIGVYAKELKTDEVRATKEFGDLVDKALERYPLNQNMPYYKAIVLISQGDKEKAVVYYKDLILRFPSKFYLWNQIAELVEDTDTKIGLLCKALNVGAEDKFLGGIRLRLAHLLFSKGLLPNAQYELNKYREVCLSQGWSLKPEYWEISGQIVNVPTVEDNQNFYLEFCPKADKFIYDAMPSIIALKVSDKLLEDRNRPGKKFVQWILRTRDGILRLKKPAKYGLGKSKNGSVFEVKVHNDKIVWINPSNINPLQQDWIRKMEGSVKLRSDRNGKTYAILEGAYIEEKLLKYIETGQYVKIIAVRQEDGRWTALSLAKI